MALVAQMTFGRFRETGNANDIYHFRTPSLLNVEMTAPYGHAGAYGTLEEMVRHYNNPNGSVDDYFDNSEWCDLPQFSGVTNCENLYSRNHTSSALAQLNRERRAGTQPAT